MKLPHSVALSALLAFVAAGCSDSLVTWEQAHQAFGEVRYKGEPVFGAQVILFPTDKAAPTNIRPIAKSEADGRFTLSTYGQNDGAPAGDYQVAVVWHPLVNTGSGQVAGENKLPAKYAKPETSELKIHIDPGVNEIPTLELN